MKKSICLETIYTEVPFEERFSLAKEDGFKYVEFWTWEDKDLKKVKKTIQETGLKIASFSGDRDYSLVDKDTSEKYIRFVEKSIEKAKYLDCKNLVIHSNALGEGGKVVNYYSDLSDYEKFGTMLNILKDLAPIAEENDINLVLEALNTKIDHQGNFLSNTKDSADLITQLNSKNVKILYDAYHMQIMEGNIINNIKKYKELIAYIHIADVPGRQEPGTGEINYNNLMEVLKGIKYNGFIGFELFPLNSSREAIDAIKRLP